jgi:predicted TIM-barrel fold metal-dependent hydrolase
MSIDATKLDDELRAAIDSLALVDHHVHGALRVPVDRAAFEQLITESDRPVPAWMTQMDSQIGFAIRRHCAPVLGCSAGVDAEEYFRRRADLGEPAVAAAFLRASGVKDYLVDTGYRSESVMSVAEIAEVSGAGAFEIVRVESVLEAVASSRPTAAALADEFRAALVASARTAVGLKSIVAYRHGFVFDPERPSKAEVEHAAAEWLREIDAGVPVRLTSPTLLRLGLWECIDVGLPLQLHVGYGDPDLDLQRCDPLRLTAWIRAVEPSGVPLMLLHCYPFHRHAGYLAQVYPHVYFDVGLALNYVGARARAVLAESLELAPFAKILYSSDAWGPAELHYLGARLWRDGMLAVMQRWVQDGEWSADDACRVATMIGRTNAERVYSLSAR